MVVSKHLVHCFTDKVCVFSFVLNLAVNRALGILEHGPSRRCLAVNYILASGFDLNRDTLQPVRLIDNIGSLDLFRSLSGFTKVEKFCPLPDYRLTNLTLLFLYPTLIECGESCAGQCECDSLGGEMLPARKGVVQLTQRHRINRHVDQLTSTLLEDFPDDSVPAYLLLQCSQLIHSPASLAGQPLLGNSGTPPLDLILNLGVLEQATDALLSDHPTQSFRTKLTDLRRPPTEDGVAKVHVRFVDNEGQLTVLILSQTHARHHVPQCVASPTASERTTYRCLRHGTCHAACGFTSSLSQSTLCKQLRRPFLRSGFDSG